MPRGEQLRLVWQMKTGERGPVYDTTFDEAAHTLQLAVHTREPARPVPATITLHDEHDPAHLTLHGEIDGHVIDVSLEKIVADHMLLRTRGFHWINEEPFNR